MLFGVRSSILKRNTMASNFLGTYPPYEEPFANACSPAKLFIQGKYVTNGEAEHSLENESHEAGHWQY